MYSDDFSYSDLFATMTLRGLLLGGLFGAIYGTAIFPIIGTLFGLFYGAIVGLGLGFGNGFLLVLISILYAHFNRLRNYMQVCTLLTTLFSLIGGVIGFTLLWNTGYRPSISPFIEIPAVIAALLTGWVTQSLTFQVEKRKRKPKEKFSYDNRPNEKFEESVGTLAQVMDRSANGIQ